jgi:uncharacterized membrane protein YGL010W
MKITTAGAIALLLASLCLVAIGLLATGGAFSFHADAEYWEHQHMPSLVDGLREKMVICGVFALASLTGSFVGFAGALGLFVRSRMTA